MGIRRSPIWEDLRSKKILVIGRQENGLYFVGRNGPNRLPSSVLSGKSPYELMFGFRPSLSYFRNFGCLCFSTILNEPDKFAYHADKCVLIGYSNVKKGYKLWSIDEKKVFFSRDVKFYEHVYPFKSKQINDEVNIDNSLNLINFFDKNETNSPEFSLTPDDEEGTTDSHDTVSDDQQPGPSTSATPGLSSSGHNLGSSVEGSSSRESGRAEDTVVSTDEISPAEGNLEGLRRSSRNVSFPKKFQDFVLNSNVRYDINKVVNYSCLSADNMSFISKLGKSTEPSCYNEASKDPKWVEAMNLEMEALMRNNTWELVDLPSGRKPIGCKWVYKIKYRSNGEIERYKARLVAKGYNQREGIDFGETFSPVVKMVTIRCVLSLAVQYDWSLYQLDINNAFLYGSISEDVYMVLPEGYYSKDESKVCKLVKSLYGLKQAPRKWNEKLTDVLLGIGFVQSSCDHSLYVLSKPSVFVVLLVYVDDIIVTGNNNLEINKVKALLSSNFQIKDLGILKYFLGLEVVYDKNGLCLNQRKYCLELLAEFGYLGCKPVNTPIELSHVVNKRTESDRAELTDITNYQKLIDSDWAKCVDTRLLGQIFWRWRVVTFRVYYCQSKELVVLNGTCGLVDIKAALSLIRSLFTPNYCYTSLYRSRVCSLRLYFVFSHLFERSAVLVGIDDHQWMIIKSGCIVPLCIDLTIVRSRVWGALFWFGLNKILSLCFVAILCCSCCFCY
ncbi:putative RNA-directed DNA polymerase [Helianthus annuus]|nr:putative RNA-directed DNA polymerase [Helianthus annuus]